MRILGFAVLMALWAAISSADEVCFSPDEECDVRLAQLIASARSSVDVAVYDINLDQVVHQLLVQSRKIKIRVLVDRRQAKTQKSLVPLLIKGGAQVRYGYQRGIMHNKFVIVDGKTLETGSFNFTRGAAIMNQENQVYLTSPAIVERYKKRFERSWAEGRPASKK
jgi:phosphatidylserine/phosphatidylglycerophosphate/cardiolipin synthase-like enzyme